MNTTKITPALEKLSFKEIVKVIIPKDFVDKIKFLCKNIPKVEWSGVLFYEIEGNISDLKNMRIICKDIFLMDKGSAGYTEYNFDEDVVDYRMNHPESFQWLVGHIHSHNTMNVFFSGTDVGELHDNAPHHNFYFSLIVNNYLDACAKIAFVGDVNVENIRYTCRDKNGEEYLVQGPAFKKQALFTVECDIEMDSVELEVSKEFIQRYNEIEKKSTENRITNNLAQKEFNTTYSNYSQNRIPDFTNHMNFKDYLESGQHFSSDRFPVEDIEEEVEEYTLEEKFTIYLLRLGNEILPNDDIESAIEDLVAVEVNPKYFAKSVMDNFASYYSRFYDKVQGKDNPNYILDVLENVILILVDYEEYAPKYLGPLLKALRSFGNQLEKNLLKVDSKVK